MAECKCVGRFVRDEEHHEVGRTDGVVFVVLEGELCDMLA